MTNELEAKTRQDMLRRMIEIRITEEQIQDILEKTSGGGKYLPEFAVNITNKAGETVSRVKKTLYIREKRHK